MNLWIRSQDKEKLIKVNCLKIVDRLIYGYYEKELNIELLAEYKTKERALEILDDIQNTIFVKNMYEQDRELLLKSWNNFDQEEIEFLRKKITVYEMPNT